MHCLALRETKEKGRIRRDQRRNCCLERAKVVRFVDADVLEPAHERLLNQYKLAANKIARGPHAKALISNSFNNDATAIATERPFSPTIRAAHADERPSAAGLAQRRSVPPPFLSARAAAARP